MSVSVLDQPAAPQVALAAGLGALKINLYHRIADAAEPWALLERAGLISPGQSLAFVASWVTAHAIAEADQFYLVAEIDGAPLAVLPLWRQRRNGLSVLGFFPGSHVGCNAPLVCPQRMVGLGPDGRRELWQRLLERLDGADMVALEAMPQTMIGQDLFIDLGRSAPGDTLYRAEFASWADADRLQRNKSRRKHDRQQGDKLAALGETSFEAVGNGPEAIALLDVLFAQRAARFKAQGIANCFADPEVVRFYRAISAADSGVDVLLHVLRLNGDVVALRFNVVFRQQIFCLISSMSDDPAIQGGSPGKQCLLRVMQTVFDAGYSAFDMGAGLTDEKRHWCNVALPLRNHYVPLTLAGRVSARLTQGWSMLRQRIKSNPHLMKLLRKLRAGSAAASSAPVDTEAVRSASDP